MDDEQQQRARVDRGEFADDRIRGNAVTGTRCSVATAVELPRGSSGVTLASTPMLLMWRCLSTVCVFVGGVVGLG
jgi:hypothetical protein